MERVPLRIPLPAVRPEQCSQGVHQAAEAGDSSPQKTGYTLHHLLGRSADHAAVAGGPGEDFTGHSQTVPSAGLPNQLGEECTHPNTDNSVLGSHSGLNPDDSVLTSGQAEGYCSIMQPGQQEEQNFNPQPCTLDRQDDSYCNGSPHSTLMLQEPPAAEEAGSPHHLWPTLRMVSWGKG